jgi:heavy metal translocating P-type ATPase
MTPLPRESVCDYCKLPLPYSPRGSPRSARDEQAPLYCCLGCRVASVIVEEKGEHGVPRTMLLRLGLSIFFTMNVMAFTMALWTTDVYGQSAAPSTLSLSLAGMFRYLVLLFSLPVLFLLGLPLFEHAWISLRQRVFSTDWLLASGVAASFAYSFLSVMRGHGPIYFEVGCFILVMTTLGRWLEVTGKLKAGAALDALARLLPERVRRISEGEDEVPLDEIRIGDLLRVLPGERFPADGRVENQAGLVDEQVLTGESRPVLKEPGDRILGGTLNLDADLRMIVTETGEKGTLARAVELVRLARQSQGRYQRLADQVASRFVPLVSAVAVVTFAVHCALGSVERGLWAALAVGLIACPCALGLAAPLAIWTALGHAAAHRVLFRSGEALERLAEIVAIRFDKTGTLTTGSAAVSHFFNDHTEMPETIQARAAALAAVSSHAMSRAIVEFAGSRRLTQAASISDVRVVPGFGVIGLLAPDKIPIVLGSRRFMRDQKLLVAPVLEWEMHGAEARGLPLALIGWGGRVRGLFIFEESWRPAAVAVMRSLTRRNIDVAVLTGDHGSRGRAIAEQLGVKVEAELLPAQKVAAIEQARSTAGPVCMVGDGINDSPALAAADVGIALGCGTDLSRDSASVCLLEDDLRRIPWSIELASRTRRVIRWNLLWAFGYNSVGVACAAVGLLNPALAAFLMVASGTLVTINSLRLGRTFEIEIDQGDSTAAASPLGSMASKELSGRPAAIDGLAQSEQFLTLETAAR